MINIRHKINTKTENGELGTFSIPILQYYCLNPSPVINLCITRTRLPYLASRRNDNAPILVHVPTDRFEAVTQNMNATQLGREMTMTAIARKITTAG